MDGIDHDDLMEAMEAMIQRGILVDTGTRRDGRIVWALSEVTEGMSEADLDRFMNGPVS